MGTEQLKELHEKTHGQPRELFVKQMLHFRGIMCSTAFTLEYKEKAFESVIEAYFRCELNEGDKDLFVSLSKEFKMRSEYEVFASLELEK